MNLTYEVFKQRIPVIRERALQQRVKLKNMHVIEALARGYGFRTYAALQATLESSSFEFKLLVSEFDIQAFSKRLAELNRYAVRLVDLID